MLNIRVIGWSANTEETIAERVQALNWQEAVRVCIQKYGGELQFVVALNDDLAPENKGFNPVGRWETMPLTPNAWRKFTGPNQTFSIMGFDHRALLPVLEYWTAPNWTMAAQKSVAQQRHAEYRFIAAFSGTVSEASILGYFSTDLGGVLPSDETPALQRRAE
ncbi:hypothetical protein [uncultured Sneathiella sp.]|jgi:hypothetical protein|uniref:hypothetical protein n=1 Tax=uncultured Sneathiella sp. TaxID=879315 RepID=UPI0030EBF702|tara:strand:+ start:75851 stop:76339 length:489 start_codon:yes stop_codon:yes gene_type:complete